MKKSQLLSTAGVALLLTVGTAYAQGNKAEHPNASQAATQDQSKGGQTAQEKSAQQHRMEKSAQQNKTENRSTTGQAQSEQKSNTQQKMNRDAAQSGKNAAQSGKNAAQSGKNESTGQAQNQKQGQNASRSAEQNAAKQPAPTEKSSTTGQANKSGNENATQNQPNAKQPSSSNAANKAAQPSNNNQAAQPSNSNQAAQPSGTGGQAQGQAQNAQAGRRGGAQMRQAQGVNLSAQQQTKVSETVFSQRNVPRVQNVDFSVNVGTVVPEHVHIVAVPSTLVQIYPQWRDDEYFVVRDEIVIVDHSRKIVAVIPAENRHASAGSSTTVVESENLSPAEIREVQTVLIQKGFLHGRVDGIWGPETRQALISFQRQEGIQATGRINSRTVSSLGLSNKIQVGGAQGQQGGGAATTGTANPSMNHQNNAPSTSGQNNAAPSKSPNSTSGQGSPNANPTPPKANRNQSMAPNNNGTTGQGNQKMQNNMQNPDHNRSTQKNEAK